MAHGLCVTCYNREYSRKWRKNNQEKSNKNSNVYYHKNKEHLKIRNRLNSLKYYNEHKEERKAYSKKWYLSNLEKARAVGRTQSKIWRKKNLETAKKTNKEYRIKNQETLKKKAKEYYNKIKNTRLYLEKRRERDKYYNKTPKRKEYIKKWRRTEKGKLLQLLHCHKKSTINHGKMGYILEHQIKQIFERDKFCVYCGSSKTLTLDHIIPLAHKLGNSTFNNYVIACGSCNYSKSSTNVFEWCNRKNIEVPNIVVNLLKKQIKEAGKQIKFLS